MGRARLTYYDGLHKKE